MNNILLALDQSSQTTGWAIYKNESLIDYGTYTPNGKTIQRLMKLREWVKKYIDEYKNEKFSIAIEEIQLQSIPNAAKGQNVKTFKVLAYTQAIILELCEEESIPCEIVASSSWKSSCGVKGRARAEQKKNALAFVKQQFNIEPAQDAADAICIGYHLTQNDCAW